MDAGAAGDAKKQMRFRIGLALIAASYPVWAVALVFAGLKLRQDGIPWLRFAFVAFVLNWTLFGLGILLAGREAVGYFNRRVRAWLKHHGETAPDETSPHHNGRVR